MKTITLQKTSVHDVNDLEPDQCAIRPDGVGVTRLWFRWAEQLVTIPIQWNGDTRPRDSTAGRLRKPIPMEGGWAVLLPKLGLRVDILR